MASAQAVASAQDGVRRGVPAPDGAVSLEHKMVLRQSHMRTSIRQTKVEAGAASAHHHRLERTSRLRVRGSGSPQGAAEPDIDTRITSRQFSQRSSKARTEEDGNDVGETANRPSPAEVLAALDERIRSGVVAQQLRTQVVQQRWFHRVMADPLKEEPAARRRTTTPDELERRISGVVRRELAEFAMHQQPPSSDDPSPKENVPVAVAARRRPPPIATQIDRMRIDAAVARYMAGDSSRSKLLPAPLQTSAKESAHTQIQRTEPGAQVERNRQSMHGMRLRHARLPDPVEDQEHLSLPPPPGLTSRDALDRRIEVAVARQLHSLSKQKQGEDDLISAGDWDHQINQRINFAVAQQLRQSYRQDAGPIPASTGKVPVIPGTARQPRSQNVRRRQAPQLDASVQDSHDDIVKRKVEELTGGTGIAPRRSRARLGTDSMQLSMAETPSPTTTSSAAGSSPSMASPQMDDEKQLYRITFKDHFGNLIEFGSLEYAAALSQLVQLNPWLAGWTQEMHMPPRQEDTVEVVDSDDGIEEAEENMEVVVT